MADDRANSDLSQLVAEHAEAVYRYAYRLTGSVHDAEDLTQQVFLTAQQRLAQLREVDRAQGWLFTIARNCFLRTASKKRPVLATSVGVDLDIVPMEEAGSLPVDSAQLQTAIDQLPVDFRLVVVMFYFEDCSYREIAERLELPLGTVMSRLARGKKQLRAAIFNAASEMGRLMSTGTDAERWSAKTHH